jgi:hypothetical protein
LTSVVFIGCWLFLAPSIASVAKLNDNNKHPLTVFLKNNFSKKQKAKVGLMKPNYMLFVPIFVPN